MNLPEQTLDESRLVAEAANGVVSTDFGETNG
jgi:hypothetical protein